MENKKSTLILLYLCCSFTIAIFAMGTIFQLLAAFLEWNFNEPFPFGVKDFYLMLKVSSIGFPIGFVLWFFNYRKL